jgi:hypothetical protein
MKCQAPGCEAEATKAARLYVPESMRASMNCVTEFDFYHCDEHIAWAQQQHLEGAKTIRKRMGGEG